MRRRLRAGSKRAPRGPRRLGGRGGAGRGRHERSAWVDGTVASVASQGRRPPTAGDKEADDKEGGSPLLPTYTLSRTGGLAASPRSCRTIADRGQTLQTGEEQNASVVVDVWVAWVAR